MLALRSFRVRLALASALISGLVLLAFGTVAWWSLSRSRLELVDDELQHFGNRVAVRTGRNVDLNRLEGSLIDVYGAEKAADRFFSLLDTSNGEILFQSSGWPKELAPASFPGTKQPLRPQPRLDDVRGSKERDLPLPKPRIVMQPRFYKVTSRGARYRIGTFANPDVTIVLGANLNQVAQDMRELRLAFLAAVPGALGIVALGAAFVVWRALRPIEELGANMERISAQELDQRLQVGVTDQEFARIIDAYNAMLERLERSFHQATRFSADASHELKTPLAIMQGSLERALNQFADDERVQEVLMDLLEQTGRQRAILESLLLLSRADAGKLRLSKQRVNLSELLQTWREDASLLAEARDIQVHSSIEPEVWIEADPILLQRVAHNLFSNAVRYNWDGGSIECCLETGASEAILTVANTGDRLADDDRERIFDRFYRSPNASLDGGLGLGLSLAREIVQAHGGRIRAENSLDRTILKVTLPR